MITQPINSNTNSNNNDNDNTTTNNNDNNNNCCNLLSRYGYDIIVMVTIPVIILVSTVMMPRLVRVELVGPLLPVHFCRGGQPPTIIYHNMM